MNTAAESLLRDSPSRGSSSEIERPWRLIDHEGSAIEIDSPATQPRARQQRRAISAIGHPLDFQAVSGVNFADLEFHAPPPANDPGPASSKAAAPQANHAAEGQDSHGGLSAELRQELIEVIQCWPTLAANLRAALLALLRASR